VSRLVVSPQGPTPTYAASSEIAVPEGDYRKLIGISDELESPDIASCSIETAEQILGEAFSAELRLGCEAPGPGSGLTAEQVRDFYAPQFAEMTTRGDRRAGAEERELVHSFSRAIGSRG
jgi:PRTRC genetic system protein C